MGSGPSGSVFGEHSFYRETRGTRLGGRHVDKRYSDPPGSLPGSHGRARQSSGTGPCGDCRRVLWVPGPRGQYSGKICFIDKAVVQVRGRGGVAMWLNVVLTYG